MLVCRECCDRSASLEETKAELSASLEIGINTSSETGTDLIWDCGGSQSSDALIAV